jgi:hypothetical protein
MQFLAWLACCAVSIGAAVAETRQARDAETGIQSWETGAQGVNLSLTQILPDQVRAFYLARGFDREAAEAYASACVFQTVLRNEGNAPISFHLGDWRMLKGKTAFRLKTEHDWQHEWAGRKLTEPARIAFRWAQFPLQQDFEPGDWNQGMTTYPLPRGACFDLKFKWRAGGKTREGIVKGVCCAQDR